MLPKKNRLKKREDFLRANREGSFFSLEGMTVKILKKKQAETRIGLVVGKKTVKTATERNKIKRKIRNAIYSQIKNIKPGLDVVVYYKRLEGKSPRENIQEKVRSLLKKSKLIIK
jgi:ribonuclease P protein component